MKKIKKWPKWVWVLVCIVAVIALITLTIALLLDSNNTGTYPEQGQAEQESTEESATDEQPQEEPADSSAPQTANDSSPTVRQNSQQSPGSAAASSDNDESNLPLCSRTRLSDAEVRQCAAEIRQKMDEENRAQQEAARAQWCDENVPKIYAEYNAKLLAENARYEQEISSSVASRINSGAPGTESIHREIAEKTYGPLHAQNVNFIINNYISTVQGHGCSLSNYVF